MVHYALKIYSLDLGFLTSPKILSQTSVLGKTSISKARELQIEFHLLHWIEGRLWFI